MVINQSTNHCSFNTCTHKQENIRPCSSLCEIFKEKQASCLSFGRQLVSGSDPWGKASCCCNTRSSKVRPESSNSITDSSHWGRLSPSCPVILQHRLYRQSKIVYFCNSVLWNPLILLWRSIYCIPNNGQEVQVGRNVSHTHLSQSICLRNFPPDPQHREEMTSC